MWCTLFHSLEKWLSIKCQRWSGLTTVHFKCTFQSLVPSVLISKSQGKKGHISQRDEHFKHMPPALAGHKTAWEKHYVYLNLLWFWKFTSKLAGTFCLFFTVLTIIMINKVIYNCFSLLSGLFDSHHQSNMTSIDKSIFQDMRLVCKKQSMITFVTTDYYPKILWSIYAKIRSRAALRMIDFEYVFKLQFHYS